MTKRESKIINYLNIYKGKINYLKNINKCSFCGGNSSILPCLKLFRCTRKKCRKTKQILYSKTIQISHLKITETLKIIEMIVNENKNKEISRVTGVVKKTIYYMKKNLRKN
ncbi:hypothetical protein GVAV_000936 [Gurleya vavrai]